MFGLGSIEIIIILAVAVIFIKPEDLPKLMRQVGKLIGQLKGLSRALNQKIREAEYSIKEEESREKNETAETEKKPE